MEGSRRKLISMAFGSAADAAGTPAALALNLLRRERRAFDPAIVQRLAPEGVEVGAGMLLLPVGLHDFVAAGVGLPGEHRHQLVRALAVVQRRDQRLHDAHRAVVGARVAPGFEIVRLVHVPLAEFGGLVLIEPEMHAERNARTLQRVGEAKVGGRIVGGISAQDDQHVHLAGAHVGDQIFQRLGLIHRVGVDRIGVENRLADVAQRLIDRVGQSVNCRRLMIAGNHDAGTAMALQVLARPHPGIFCCSARTMLLIGVIAEHHVQRDARTISISAARTGSRGPPSRPSNSACSRPHTAGSSRPRRDCGAWRNRGRSA